LRAISYFLQYFADPDLGSQDVADPDPNPKHCMSGITQKSLDRFASK